MTGVTITPFRPLPLAFTYPRTHSAAQRTREDEDTRPHATTSKCAALHPPYAMLGCQSAPAALITTAATTAHFRE
ncbi:hypothetical protein AAHC03_01050 [Spirometra sp. Aus1]